MHDEAGKNPPPNPASRDAPDQDESDIPALALGALDAGACDAAEREINASPEGRLAFAAYAEAVGALGLATPEARPRVELRDRILGMTGAAPAAPVELARERQRRLPAAWLASLAAAVLIVALAGLAALQWLTANDRADQVDELRTELQAREARIDELEQAAARAGVFVNFEQPLVWRPFQISDRPEGAWGYLIHTPDGRTAYLIIAGMHIDENHVFQAWVVQDSPESAGTLRTDGAGMGFLILQHDGEPLQNFRRVGVTIEPPGGSPQPTSDPVMIAEIA